MKHLLRYLFLSLMVAFLICLGGCSSQMQIKTIQITENLSMVPGDSMDLPVMGTLKDGAAIEGTALKEMLLSEKAIYESSAPAIVAVDEKGILTALADGTAEICVSTKDKKLFAATIVTVSSELTELVADDIITNTNEKYVRLDVKPVPETAKVENLSYSIEDESIVTIVDGALMPCAAGKTLVTITSGDVSKTISVTVQQAAVELCAADVYVQVGQTQYITVNPGVPNAEAGIQYTYTSGDNRIAAVDVEGGVIGISPGETTVTIENEYGLTCVTNVHVREEERQIVVEYN